MCLHFDNNQTDIRNIHLTRSRRSLLKPTTCGTVVKILRHECLASGILSVNATCHCLQMAARAHLSARISNHCNVSPKTYIVISGFWVGPDIEDGWGFIEAFVNQIY
ncbi:hypothetical protein DCAR_0933871 [Daucus carota subsp. sativus]|uniref:Uncharacterized protein n=1 Tax=Daucus carota subsp. sativus TaxID=79200 RepID=A0AAF0XW09_DAUCS|nr:hypothetical protein DCAR_0933871 [Daucus carota subsp. sativus]